MGGSALLVATDRDDRTRLSEALERGGWRVAAHESPRMALSALGAEEFDVLVVGEGVPAAHELLDDAVAQRPDIPSALVDPSSDAATLGALIERVRSERTRTYRLKRLPDPVDAHAFDALLGSSAAIQAVRQRLARLASTDAPVLLVGETGTGKEIAARALHDASDRGSKAFVAVNCAALPTELLESELFGHEEGAFTSAVGARDGLVAAANGGTLFLDEIQSLPMEAQPKLLRVVEDEVVRPIGSRREITSDIRLLTATNVDLRAEVARGNFRSDLLFRIDVLEVRLPSLRERDGDVLELATRFLADAATRLGRSGMHLSPAAEEAIERYAWPGNVRELAHAMESVAALAEAVSVEVTDLPAEVGEAPRERSAGGSGYGTLQSMREAYARRVLQHVGGNKKAAAKILGISRQRLYRLLD